MRYRDRRVSRAGYKRPEAVAIVDEIDGASTGTSAARGGALGHAIAAVCAEGQEIRSRPHRCPQRRLPHWRRWLGVENRGLVPFTSFAEDEHLPDGRRPPVWFAFNERARLHFSPHLTRWTSVRKVKEGESTNDLSPS